MEYRVDRAGARRLPSRGAWILLFVVVALVLVLGGYAYYLTEIGRLRTERYNNLSAIGQLKVSQIVEWRQEQLRSARLSAEDPLMHAAVTRLLRAPDDAANRERLRRRLRLEQQIYGYHDVQLTNLDGEILLAAVDAPPPIGEVTAAALNEALSTGEATLSDLFRGPRGEVHMDAVAPMRDEAGEPVAALILHVNASTLLFPLIQQWPTPSETAETLLVRKDGEDVLFLNDLRHQSGASFSLRIPLSRSDLPAAQAIQGRQGRATGDDYRGVPVLAYLEPVPDSPWYLVAKWDESEIRAGVRSRAAEIYLTVTLVILLSGVGLAYLYRRRQAGLYRDLYRAEKEHHQVLEEQRAILVSMGDGVITTDVRGRVNFLNPVAEELTGYGNLEARGRPLAEIFSIVNTQTGEPQVNPVREALEGDQVVGLANHSTLVARDGSKYQIADSAAPVRDANGEITGAVLIFRDVTDSYQMEEAVRASERHFRLLFTNAVNGVALHEIILDEAGEPVDYRFLEVNDAFESHTGLAAEEVIGRRVTDILPGIEETDFIEIYGRVALEGTPVSFEDYSPGLDRHFRIHAYQTVPGQFAAVFHDISERKRAAEETRVLQEQLNQAQRLESVGRLAGGVAHDFNNMLSVISTNAELALRSIDRSHALYLRLQEILKATRRSADLTRQLLAFARKQTAAPQVINLNDAVGEMLVMLRRLIGESIDLVWQPGPDLWPVKIDPAQLDQILANLNVNARDAIDGVGRITVETANVVIGEGQSRTRPGFLPGEYVLLAVTDDGHGMDRETLGHIFEPFFTTKGAGEGTGLGLATVYGIVKQNLGFINVYSEPGLGATFRIYLPRYEGVADRPVPALPTEHLVGGTETVLLVEDEPAILDAVQILLKAAGYTVLAAGTPSGALQLAKASAGKIQLLITDVILPEMNGPDLAEELQSLYPGLKCLFMSGFTASAIAHQDIMDEGVGFIQKPFTLEALDKKIRQVLSES